MSPLAGLDKMHLNLEIRGRSNSTDKPPSQPNDERSGAVSKASTVEPLENGFRSFTDRTVTGKRKMNLHPDNEEEIIAEMKRNKNKERAQDSE